MVKLLTFRKTSVFRFKLKSISPYSRLKRVEYIVSTHNVYLF